MSLDSEFVYVPSAGDRHSSCRCVLRTHNLWTAAAAVPQGVAMRERERSGLILLNRSTLLSSYTLSAVYQGPPTARALLKNTGGALPAHSCVAGKQSWGKIRTAVPEILKKSESECLQARTMTTGAIHRRCRQRLRPTVTATTANTLSLSGCGLTRAVPKRRLRNQKQRRAAPRPGLPRPRSSAQSTILRSSRHGRRRSMCNRRHGGCGAC